MSSTVKSAEEWFENQKADGLVDINLAITNARGASVRTVLDDLLNIEVLAKANRTQDLPGPEVLINSEAQAAMMGVVIQ